MPYLPLALRRTLLLTALAACGAPGDTPRAREEHLASRAPHAPAADAAESAPRSVVGAVAGGAGHAFNAPSANAVAQAAVPAAPPAPVPPRQPPQAGDSVPMLVRTGTASVEVDSLDAALARLRALVASVGGYVASSSLATGREQVRSATLELKVPAPRFDALVHGLGPLGRVETVDVGAQDVGEEYVDLAAREANARRLEARLVALLEQRAGRLADVLAVERELARVREEIERAEGRLRYLRARVAYATLTVTVHEPPPVVGRHPEAAPIADAFRQAWRNFIAAVAWLIAASGVLVPAAGLALAGRAAWLHRGRLPGLKR